MENSYLCGLSKFVQLYQLLNPCHCVCHVFQSPLRIHCWNNSPRSSLPQSEAHLSYSGLKIEQLPTPRRRSGERCITNAGSRYLDIEPNPLPKDKNAYKCGLSSRIRRFRFPVAQRHRKSRQKPARHFRHSAMGCAHHCLRRPIDCPVAAAAIGGILFWTKFSDERMMQQCMSAYERQAKAPAAPEDYFGRELRQAAAEEAKRCEEFAARKQAVAASK